MSDVGNQAVWSAVVDGLTFNPEAAIPQLWAQLRAAGTFLGPPISGELERDGGGVEQSFSSGAVIAWTPDNGAWLDS